MGDKSWGTLTVGPLTDLPSKERGRRLRKELLQKWVELEPGPDVLTHRLLILKGRLWEEGARLAGRVCCSRVAKQVRQGSSQVETRGRARQDRLRGRSGHSTPTSLGNSSFRSCKKAGSM